jgi:hypothetical protein
LAVMSAKANHSAGFCSPQTCVHVPRCLGPPVDPSTRKGNLQQGRKSSPCESQPAASHHQEGCRLEKKRDTSS